MKKLLVLIVLLVFGLSFVGASSAFGEKIEYYLEEPGEPNNRCYVDVHISPHFRLQKVGGNCSGPRPANPEPISKLELIIRVKEKKASLLQGWIYIPGNSPGGRYCYVHPVTKQYQCIYW